MNIFSGIVTALATPFSDGDLDLASYRKLLKFQLDAGIDGFVVNGTTGESPNLSIEEVKKLFEATRSEAGKEFPIILGTGSNSTSATIENTMRAEQWGASAALVVVPYYNKPTQEGLVMHFTKVAESVKIPVILYNVPGRTVVSMTAETVNTLSKVKNIVGIKEATGDVSLGVDIRKKTGTEFTITSGDDPTCVELCQQGGDGVISVISHIIPGELKQYCASARDGDESASERYVSKYKDLLEIVYSEPNPIGIKMALYKMGIFDSPELRLPLLTFSKSKTQELHNEMKNLGLIS